MLESAPHRGETTDTLNYAVEIERVSVSYGDTSVLEDVSLDVSRDDFISLIGPSGCGKTTLLRLIADLSQPDSGAIRVLGTTADAVRRGGGYGYVFQSPALLPWRTCAGNVRLPLQVLGWQPDRQREATDRMLRIVGLADAADLYPSQLSGGMQQRVSIARALAFEPNLLLMDEPFGALDEITRDGLNLHLHELWARGGLTVAFVTHSIPEAVFLSTRIVVMTSGPGRIIEIIESDLPRQRTLGVRDSAAFHDLSARVRAALERGHSYG